MPANKFKEYLDSQKVKYLQIDHSPAFTAQEVAAAAHISGKQLAKVVIITIEGQLAMVVLPAHDHVNFSALKETLGKKDIDLAAESTFKSKFPDCEVGTMPPFGNLYGLPVYVSDELGKNAEIVFNACSHSELMKMAYQDFASLVKPTVIAA
jgi:Ala-tRNA(Pro) deacylase